MAGTPPVTLRPGTAQDADAIGAIWHRGWGDGHRGFVPDELAAVRTKESFHRRAAERATEATVAEIDGAVAGFVIVVGDEVEQVYVDRAFRGTGVAGVLIAEAERQVRANGHDEAWLAVVAGNARARAFYERSGWRDDGAFLYEAAVERGTMAVPCLRYVKRV